MTLGDLNKQAHELMGDDAEDLNLIVLVPHPDNPKYAISKKVTTVTSGGCDTLWLGVGDN